MITPIRGRKHDTARVKGKSPLLKDDNPDKGTETFTFFIIFNFISIVER